MESNEYTGIVLRTWKKNAEFFVEAEIKGGGSFAVVYEPASWTPILGENVDFVFESGHSCGHRIDRTIQGQLARDLFRFDHVTAYKKEFADKIGGYPEGTDVYDLSMQKAYRDVCRTMHKIQNFPNKNQILNESKQWIKNRIESLAQTDITTKEEFREWHQATCDGLISIFKEFSYDVFTYGQAQKWVNMTLKYLYCSGEALFGRHPSLFHIPLDNYVFEAVSSWPDYEKVKFNVPWSKQNDYGAYLAFQTWFAQRCGGCPINAEFLIWNSVDNKVKKERLKQENI